MIKFTTLFGLLAVELAVSLTTEGSHVLVYLLAALFFLVSMFFVYRSFYGMRIKTQMAGDEALAEPSGSDGSGVAQPDLVDQGAGE